MRWMVPCLAAAACTPSDTEILPEDLDEATFEGSFRSDEGCIAGDVALDVVEVSPGQVEGVYHYESENGAWATYAVAGTLDDRGLLVLDQLFAEADPDANWCYGTLELGWDPLAGGISGAWEAQDCGCTGTVSLPDEAPRGPVQ